MRTAVHTESHTHAATHTPTALHVDTGELHRNTHPHTSCTHAEPHTHTRTHARSHTAVLLASQPGKTIACSEGTQSPATCARPSTRTRPHPAGHVLTPAWAQPHLGPPPAAPPAVTHAEPKVGVCVRMDMGSRDTGQPGETSSPAGQTPACAQARSSHRHTGAPRRQTQGRAQPSWPLPPALLSGRAGEPLGLLEWTGSRRLRPRSRERGPPRPFSPLLDGAGPCSFLSLGWRGTCLLPACLHGAPQGRTNKRAAQIQVKQENHLFYSKSWKLQ